MAILIEFPTFCPHTSHIAIEAIGGLNLPDGGGGFAPFEKCTLREVKWLSSVNKVNSIMYVVLFGSILQIQ